MGFFTRDRPQQKGQLIIERLEKDQFSLFVKLESGAYLYPRQIEEPIMLYEGDSLTIPVLIEGNPDGIYPKRIVLFDCLRLGRNDPNVENWSDCF